MFAYDQFPKLNIPSNVERMLAAAGVAALAAGTAVVAYFDPSETHLFPVCPLYSLTGLACPGCGLTRGFHALFHGDLPTAFHFNALIPVWAVIFGYVLVSFLLLAVCGKGLPMWPTNPKFMTLFMAVLLTFGVLRNIPVYPFSLLFP
jgi:hypothetical protein